MNGAAIASDNTSNKRRSSPDGESAELIKSLRAIGKKEYPCADNMDAFQWKEREQVLETTVYTLQSDNASLSNKLAALSTDNAMQANQLNSLEVENDALKAQISGLSKEQRALAKTGFEAALKHDAEVKDIETKTAKWRARETMLLEQIKGLKTELKALKNEGKRIEKERRTSTKMEATGSQDLIEELKAANRKSEATVVTLNEQMHGVRLELDGLSSKLVYESEKAGHLQGQVDLLTTERQDLLEERDTLLQEVKHFELLIKEKIQEAFEEENDEAESAQCVPVKKDQSCSPMKLSMASNRESFFLGLVSGNSLAGELASVNDVGEVEMGGDHSALVSENEALKDEIVGLTMYINKLIQQVDQSDAEALVENQPRISANDGANTIRRKLLSSIRKFSGSKGALNPSQSLIYDHREWMNKHGSMDDAPEFMKESAKEAQLTKCPSNESEFSNVTAGSGVVDSMPASVTGHNKKEGVLSSIKSLGSWMVGSAGTGSATAAPAKTLNEQEPAPHSKVEEKTEKRRSTAGNSKMLLSELLEKQRAEDGDILEFKEVKRLEKALAKVGYRQSRILENKRAVVRLKE
ncbi:hypothetical protein BJ741DRAFT_409364 [Chytriomyces cf. hyalinus JEL632]|nr:hypothetical protein BJ741DRAFT_409364 [Chytriomyces cf. hyalinus JEL632]